MIFRKYSIGFLLLLILANPINTLAQLDLSLDKAIEEAINNNFGIQIASKQIEAAENQIYKGAAGLTPVIDWNLGVNANINQVNQKFFDGRVINRLGQAYAPATSANLTWTLYNGGRGQLIMERLKSNGQQSILEQKLVVQNTMALVMQAYYDILRLNKTGAFLNTIVKYYEERLKLTDERWQIGRGSKLDYLQSKTDLTTQQAEITNNDNNIKNAKVRLNTLLGASPTRNFEVVDDVITEKRYNLDELLAKAETANKDLIILNKAEEISNINIKESETFRKPQVNLNSSLGYNFNKNNAGFQTFSQSYGLNNSLSARWNIFNGQQTQRNIQAAKIDRDIILKQKENLSNQIASDITTAFFQYETAKKLLELENENKTLAEENLTISLEKFRLGASTILELNDAQRRFDLSLNRLVNAEFNVRISELELLRLSGSLVE